MSRSHPEQRIERVPGSRRVRLTPAPGTGGEPVEASAPAPQTTEASGPNDERMRREVPPHY